MEVELGPVTGGAPIKTEYGFGAMGEIAYEDTDLFSATRGLLFNLEVSYLQKDDDSGTPIDGACHTGVFLGLLAECFDRVDIQSDTWVVDAALLQTFRPFEDPSIRVAIGPSVLWVKDNKNADYLYPSNISDFVTRDTSFFGGGLKAGIGKSFALTDRLSFAVDAFAAAVYGRKKTDIDDIRTRNGAFEASESASFSDNLFVYTAEITPVFSYALDGALGGASFEFGGAYKHIWNPLFTSNTESYFGNPGPFALGDRKDDIGVLSGFIGLTVPLD